MEWLGKIVGGVMLMGVAIGVSASGKNFSNLNPVEVKDPVKIGEMEGIVERDTIIQGDYCFILESFLKDSLAKPSYFTLKTLFLDSSKTSYLDSFIDDNDTLGLDIMKPGYNGNNFYLLKKVNGHNLKTSNPIKFFDAF